MKRCPQCNNVFEQASVYCPLDAALLIDEEFAMPSQNAPDEEEITIIRQEPVKIDIPPSEIRTEQFQHPPVRPQVVPVVVQPRRSTGKYLAFLLIGLLLGGTLVLAGLLFANNFFRSKKTEVAVNAGQNEPPVSNVNAKTATPQPSRTASAKHQQPTETADEEFNGRVIALNAYVRSSPNRTSSQVDILPVDDRLTIMNRENDDSPWFFVSCEHGTSGWMHGNTIEYTR